MSIIPLYQNYELFPSYQNLQKQKELIIILKATMNSTKALIKLEENSSAQERRNSSEFKGPFRISKLQNEISLGGPKISEWSIMENAKYAVFIERNCSKMSGKPHGKLWGLYQDMAKIIKTRNFRQCKLHHQRLLNDIGDIPDIISFLVKQIPQFQEIFLQEKEHQEEFSQNRRVSEKKNIAVQNEGQEKQDKEDMIPTDSAYRSQMEAETEKAQSEKKMFFMGKFQQNYNWGSPKFSSRAEKWKQCHNYFIQWTSRLNELMAPQLEY